MKNKIYYSLFPDLCSMPVLPTRLCLFIPKVPFWHLLALYQDQYSSFLFTFPLSSFSYVLFESTGEALILLLFWGRRGRRAGQRVVLGLLGFDSRATLICFFQPWWGHKSLPSFHSPFFHFFFLTNSTEWTCWFSRNENESLHYSSPLRHSFSELLFLVWETKMRAAQGCIFRVSM